MKRITYIFESHAYCYGWDHWKRNSCNRKLSICYELMFYGALLDIIW